MSDGIQLIYNDKSGRWEEKPEPYCVLEVQTEEEFKFIQKAIKSYEALIDRHWDDCRLIDAYAHENYELKGGK